MHILNITTKTPSDMFAIKFKEMFIAIIFIVMAIQPIESNKVSLFDFTTLKSVEQWTEISDTVRTVGKSKATLVLQTTAIFQNAIFFSLLHPQPNGAGFAGVRTPVALNLSGYTKIAIRCRGEGENSRYKIVLKHNSQTSNDDTTYEHVFMVSMSNIDFSEVKLKLKDFKPFYRGREVTGADPLNTSNITSFGIQIFGGVYSEFKQGGVSALIIETISAMLFGKLWNILCFSWELIKLICQ